ncbi:lipid II flippase MurJ, partial [Ancylobacter polymorphus]|uniref:lipid II flippase MurJ n=1 Tax=Ancylobacter polymorphus TaxID=223390 RepID=UPI00364338B2
ERFNVQGPARYAISLGSEAMTWGAVGAVLMLALAGGRGTAEEPGSSPTALGAGGLIAALALSLPAALGLAVLAHPIVVVLFQRGAFDPQASELTATALALLALTLPAQALEKVLIAIAFASGLPRLVTRASLAALPLGALAGFLTVGALGVAGPALGVLVSSLVALGGLALGLARRRLVVLGKPLRRQLLRLSLAALAMAGTVLLARLGCESLLAQGGLAAAGALIGLVALGGAVYAGLALTLGGVTLTALRAALRR